MKQHTLTLTILVFFAQASVAQTFVSFNNGFPSMVMANAAFADYDNDGDPDLAFTGFSGTVAEVSAIYRNDGGGVFTLVDSLYPVAGGAVSWGDYDQDGDADLLVNGQHNGTFNTSLYRNDGAGVFTPVPTALPHMMGISRWIDYDGDDFPDVILSGYGNTLTNDSTLLFHNNAGTGFTEVPGVFPGFYASDIAPADYDNDGDLDFFVAGAFDGPTTPVFSALYENTGAGTFVQSPQDFFQLSTGTIKWADYDMDGDPDLLYDGIDSTSVNSFTKLYRNNGAAGFAEVPIDLPGSGEPGSVDWGDVDLDGDLDILLGGPTLLLRNEGSDVFTDITPGNIDYAVPNVFCDVDLDGDLDILSLHMSGGLNASTVYRNDLGLSAGELFATAGVQLYPNPAGSQAWIGGLEGPAAVTVFSSTGAVVQVPAVYNQGRMLLTVHHLPTGIYLVRLTTVNGVLNAPLVISR